MDLKYKDGKHSASGLTPRTSRLDRFFWASPFYVFSFFIILFCLVPCGRLSWLLVSFWAHVNIVHHIISYHNRRVSHLSRETQPEKTWEFSWLRTLLMRCTHGLGWGRECRSDWTDTGCGGRCRFHCVRSLAGQNQVLQVCWATFSLCCCHMLFLCQLCFVLVHGQVTIIFVVSVCLCRVFLFSQPSLIWFWSNLDTCYMSGSSCVS